MSHVMLFLYCSHCVRSQPKSPPPPNLFLSFQKAINMSNMSFVSLKMLNQALVLCSVACLPPPLPLPPRRLLLRSASLARRSLSFASIVLVVLSMHCFNHRLLSRQLCNVHGLTALLLACRCV